MHLCLPESGVSATAKGILEKREGSLRSRRRNGDGEEGKKGGGMGREGKERLL